MALLLALHAGGDVDDLAGAEAAIGGELVPKAAIDPRGAIIGEGIDGRAGGSDGVVCLMVRIDEFAQQRIAVPAG